MIKRLILLVMLSAFPGRCVPAATVRLYEDKIWLSAKGDALATVLNEFARLGVEVRLDPRVTAKVTGLIEGEDVQATLGKLLAHFDYAITWEVLPGPLGDLRKLSEIQVFMPGEKQAARPISAATDELAVTRGLDGVGPLYVRDEVLVGVKPGVKKEDFLRLLTDMGGTVVQALPGVGVYLVRLPPNSDVEDLIRRMSSNPMLAKMEPNYVTALPPSSATGGQVGAQFAPAVPADGTPPVAVLDSGLLAGAGLDGLAAGKLDALNPERALGDEAGHGTQMAMIAAGLVAPDGAGEVSADGLPLVAVRAFDKNGLASNYSLMRGLEYALSKGARVINLSWGTTTSSDMLAAAVAYAMDQGAVVVAAAGNQANGIPMYPAAYAGVVAVSAALDAQTAWDQSNYGSFVTLAAPCTASFPVGYAGPPGNYAGTSISAAYVSRALGLYFAQHPKATREQAVDALSASLTEGGASGRDPQFGSGYLDQQALQKFLAP